MWQDLSHRAGRRPIVGLWGLGDEVEAKCSGKPWRDLNRRVIQSGSF